MFVNMKTRFFVVALLMAAVTFSACPSKKSSENTIAEFKVNGVRYTVANDPGTITHFYPKTPPTGGATVGTWPTRPDSWPTVSSSIVEVVPTSPKATHNLPSTLNFSSPVTFTVTAENGDPKTFTITVTSGELN